MTELLIEYLSLIGQAGIRKPVSTKGALSIRTTFMPPSAACPYQDEEDVDGLLRYQIRGADPQQSDNVALRRVRTAGWIGSSIAPLIFAVSTKGRVLEDINHRQAEAVQ